MIKYTRQRGDSLMSVEVETAEELRQVLNVLDAADEDTALVADSDGWIEWNGRYCPVPDNTKVDVIMSNGAHDYACKAGDWNWIKDRVGYGAYVAKYRIVSDANAQ